MTCFGTCFRPRVGWRSGKVCRVRFRAKRMRPSGRASTGSRSNGCPGLPAGPPGMCYRTTACARIRAQAGRLRLEHEDEQENDDDDEQCASTDIHRKTLSRRLTPPAIDTPAARNRLQGGRAGDCATTNADCVKVAIIPACSPGNARREVGSRTGRGHSFAAWASRASPVATGRDSPRPEGPRVRPTRSRNRRSC